MPVYEIEAGGKRYQVDAPDMDTASASAQQFTSDAGVSKSSSLVPAAIRDVPSEIGKAAGQAVEALGRVRGRGEQGTFEGLMNTGRAAMALPELALSPLTGAARSLLGHPVADVETAIGGLIDPKVAAERAASGAAYEDAKHSVDTAMSALATRGAPVAAAAAAGPVAPAVSEGQSVIDAARRVANVVGSDVDVPRAIASDNIAVQRAGQGIRNLPVVGDAIPRATAGLVDDLGGAVKTIADQHGAGSGTNVANRIGRVIQNQAQSETRAATDAARRSDEAVAAAWQRDIDAAHQAIAAREGASLDDARRAVGDMTPQEMGSALTERLRTGEQAARAEKDALYARAGNMDASVRADEVANVRSRVAQGLEDAGTVVDKDLTPAANRMIDELQRLSNLEIPNKAVGARVPASGTEQPVAVSVQGIEQARKRLSFFRGAAQNDADRRAAGQIIRLFDEWERAAFDNAMFSGSDEALRTYKQAASANASWRRRFYNDQDDAGRLIERIVTGEVTPQEVANYVVGAGRVGAKGVSSRLLTRIAEATGNDPDAMQAIRGGVWNRLTQATEGVDAPRSAKVANDIYEFLNGSGGDIAARLFTPEQQGIMSAYADTLRHGEQARQIVGDVAGTTRPQAMEVGPGPMQQLADTVLGRGGKSDEALFTAIDAYARSGSRGDIGTLSKLVRAVPEQDRGDLAGAVIRNLGISPRTGQFSPDVFVSQWKTYTPQAKAILFGNAGPQRQALDDIAVISDRLKQIGSRFGNPSGTAQNANFLGLATGLVTAPLTTLASAIGGFGVAKILSAPAGASSVAKWSKAYSGLLTKPSPQALGLFQVASRNLANNAQALGIQSSVGDLMRALQSPATSGAQEQDQVPRPPGQ